MAYILCFTQVNRSVYLSVSLPSHIHISISKISSLPSRIAFRDLTQLHTIQTLYFTTSQIPTQLIPSELSHIISPSHRILIRAQHGVTRGWRFGPVSFMDPRVSATEKDEEIRRSDASRTDSRPIARFVPWPAVWRVDGDVLARLRRS
ncbi:hypothetical protein DL98DRAFT_509146 [Cadophora sp. DSE1049]|nr:hypothetical protein DL98DRAFT_509146 [Cadophora sp. DSE1049]